jgi:hypothetical protein
LLKKKPAPASRHGWEEKLSLDGGNRRGGEHIGRTGVKVRLSKTGAARESDSTGWQRIKKNQSFRGFRPSKPLLFQPRLFEELSLVEDGYVSGNATPMPTCAALQINFYKSMTARELWIMLPSYLSNCLRVIQNFLQSEFRKM